MPTGTTSLHGSAPDTARVALVIVDVLDDLDFDGGAALLRHALPRARPQATLARQARRRRIPVIYANDNFGRGRSSFDDVLDYCRGENVRDRPLVELLEHFSVRRLVLGGISGDVCIPFTAHDAYTPDYELHVPSDCIAPVSPDENRRTLACLRRDMRADTTPSTRCDLAPLTRG